jgi:hypothetical protein
MSATTAAFLPTDSATTTLRVLSKSLVSSTHPAPYHQGYQRLPPYQGPRPKQFQLRGGKGQQQSQQKEKEVMEDSQKPENQMLDTHKPESQMQEQLEDGGLLNLIEEGEKSSVTTAETMTTSAQTAQSPRSASSAKRRTM